MGQNTFSNLGRQTWAPTFGTFGAIGLCDEIDPTGLKIIKDPIKTGTTGKLTLGHRVVDVEGTIKIICREITGGNTGLILAMFPWNGSTVPGGGMLIAPPMNTDLYTYAQTLRLHPLGAGDNSQDLVLLNAAPICAIGPKRNGQKDDEWMLEFQPYPTRTSLATAPTAASWGTVGGA